MEPSSSSQLRAALAAGQYEAVLGAFCSLSAVEDRCRSSLQALLEDLAFVLREAPAPLPAEARLPLPGGGCVERRALSVLETLLDAHKQALARNPETLFPTLYNEIFWLDAPVRSEHEERPPQKSQEQGLWRWMEAWRAEHAARTPRASWLRRLRPPAVLEAELPSWGLEGEPYALSADGALVLVRRAAPGYASGEPWRLTELPLPEKERLVACSGGCARLYELERLGPLAELTHEGEVRQAMFVGKGRLLLTATQQNAYAWRGTDGARVASAAPGPRARLRPTDDGPVLLYHPDGCRLWSFDQTFATSLKGEVSDRIQRTVAGKVIKYRLEKRYSNIPSSLVLVDTRTGLPSVGFVGTSELFGRVSPDGRTLLICGERAAQLWSMQGLAPLAVLGPLLHRTNGALFSSDGATVVISTREELRAFRVSDGALLSSLSLACDGPLLPAGEGRVLSYDGKAWRLWDYAANALLGAPMPSSSQYYSAASPRGDRLITNIDSQLVGWALPECTRLFTSKGSAQGIRFDPDGDTFTTDNYEGQKRYHATTGEILPNNDTRPLDPTGRFRISYAPNHLVLSDAATGRPIAQVPRGDKHFLSNDGKILVVGGEKGTRIADLSRLSSGGGWKEDAPLILNGSPRLSPSGATVLLNERGGISFWEVARGRLRQRYQGEERKVLFSNGEKVLTRRGDLLIARSMEDGALLWQVEQKAPAISAIEWSYAADFAGVVLCDTRAGDVFALDAMTGQERYRIPDAHLTGPCGAQLFTTQSANKEASLRDTATGEPLMKLPSGGSRYQLSQDRRWLARVVEYKGIEVWDLSTQTLRHTINTSASWFRLREDPPSIVTHESETPQSGNQDLVIERAYALESGALLESREWWEQNVLPDPPSGQLAPGVSFADGKLSLHGEVIKLPYEAEVCLAQDGSLYVVGSSRDHLDLYVVEGDKK